MTLSCFDSSLVRGKSNRQTDDIAPNRPSQRPPEYRNIARDELIRAVSLQGQGSPLDLTAEHSSIRIFVRKEDTGSLTVVVSDAGEDDRGCRKRLLCTRRGSGGVVEASDPVPVADTLAQYNDGFGGVAVPVGPRTVWLGGVRTGMGRSFPGREGNFRYPASVALSASPVPSEAGGSVAGGTPVSIRSSPVSLHAAPLGRRDPFSRNGRGASVFFDSVRSFGSGGGSTSGSDTGGGGGGGGAAAQEASKNGSLPAAFDGDEEDAPASSGGATSPRRMGVANRGGERQGGGWRSSLFSSGAGTSPAATGGEPAAPPLGLASRRAAAESLFSSIRRGGEE